MNGSPAALDLGRRRRSRLYRVRRALCFDLAPVTVEYPFQATALSSPSHPITVGFPLEHYETKHVVEGLFNARLLSCEELRELSRMAEELRQSVSRFKIA